MTTLGTTRQFAAIATVALALLSIPGCGQRPPAGPPPGAPGAISPSPAATQPPATEQLAGKDVSSVKLPLADGSEKTIGDYRGKVLLLDFWATFCQPCIEKLPELQQMRKRFADKPVEFIAVSLDPELETAVAWAKAHGITLPVAKFTDEMREVFFQGAKAVVIPQARLIDASGRLVKAWDSSARLADIEQAIAGLLAKRTSRP